MKQSIIHYSLSIAAAVLATAFSIQTLEASPYASELNYDSGAGTVSFYLNEDGGNVTVKYEDGTTNATFDGVSATATNLTKGLKSFSMGGHTGYAIAVTKNGNGVPAQISVDTAANANSSTNYTYWNSPRGVAVNSNPKIGKLFGRVYVGNSAASTSGNPKQGIYILHPDLSPELTNTAVATSPLLAGNASSPYHLGVNQDDGSVSVNDFSGNGALYLFSPDLDSYVTIFSKTNGIHGDGFGTAKVTGSIANGNMVVWFPDSGMAVPDPAVYPNLHLPSGTEKGMYNNIYRYDIGAGPLPYTNAPDFAFNYGLDSIAELVVQGDVAPDGKVFTGFGRANLSNPDVVVFDPVTFLQNATPLWSSWISSKGLSDPFAPPVGSPPAPGNQPYGGVRVSSDEKYFATMGILNGFMIVKLTNGIPDISTIFEITNTPSTGNARGMDWDAADNIYGASSGQALLRVYSLGNTKTCVTSNDITGTNGTFVVLSPPVTATSVATVPTASQNHGSPIDGVITVYLNTNVLAAPTVVAYARSGTATYPANYTLNLVTNADGVIISSNSVTFPAGTWPHAGNWSADVHLTPTATPASGPALAATFTLAGGVNYGAGTPLIASVAVVNTGPQLLLLTPLGTSFSRGIPNDYVTFAITRWGDTSVPDYTITNINYSGTMFPADFTAGAQSFSGSLLSDGSPGITIPSGAISVTSAIGNPVLRANLNVPPTNVTIVITLTNSAGTNLVANNGFAYVVSATNFLSVVENDNALGGNGGGGGVTLWSDPLTNAAASTNWTLTFATQAWPGVATSSYTTNYSYVTNSGVITTNIAGVITNVTYSAAPPVVIPAYTNGQTAMNHDPVNGTNDFDVEFGYTLPSDFPLSPVMIANGWSNVLRMTVNKNVGSPAAVNLYPISKQFYGNYALKFSMYLSLLPDAIHTISPLGNFSGRFPNENAIAGINHYGTNINWRLGTTPATSTASQSGVANSDGIWLTLGASDGVGTPADFDVFRPPAIPNLGMYNSGSSTISDLASDAGSSHRNDFPNTLFPETANVAGGEPVRKWVDVSAETTDQTNLVFKVNGFPVATVAFPGQGSGNTVWLASNNVPLTPYTSGDIMLGYQDPDKTIGDPDSQFVYYSNVRVIELSPYITAHPAGVILTNGSSASFTSSAAYATAPLTGTWYKAASPTAPILALQTDIGGTNLTTTLALASLTVGTNYVVIYNDAAGSVTSGVARVELITGPTSISTNSGVDVQFTVIANGPLTPTYQWSTNGVNLADGAHYGGVTNATLTITNVQPSDAGTYSVTATNADGSLTVSATLTVSLTEPPVFSGMELVGTNAVLTFTSPNGTDTTNSFTLQSSPQVQGPYVVTPGTITGGMGVFQFIVPLTTNSDMFYRLTHN